MAAADHGDLSSYSYRMLASRLGSNYYDAVVALSYSDATVAHCYFETNP